MSKQTKFLAPERVGLRVPLACMRTTVSMRRLSEHDAKEYFLNSNTPLNYVNIRIYNKA